MFRFFRSVIYTLDAESFSTRVDWSCDAKQGKKNQTAVLLNPRLQPQESVQDDRPTEAMENDKQSALLWGIGSGLEPIKNSC